MSNDVLIRLCYRCRNLRHACTCATISPMRACLYLIAIVIGIVVLNLAGCAHDPMVGYYRGVSGAAVAAETCRDVLSTAHEENTSEVGRLAKSGKTSDAALLLDNWLVKYARSKTVCNALKEGSQAALAAGPVVESAVDKEKNVAVWLARLSVLAAEVVKTFAEFGLKLPGGK